VEKERNVDREQALKNLLQDHCIYSDGIYLTFQYCGWTLAVSLVVALILYTLFLDQNWQDGSCFYFIFKKMVSELSALS